MDAGDELKAVPSSRREQYAAMFRPRGNRLAIASIVVDSVGSGMFLSLTLLFLWRVNGVRPEVAGPVVTAAALLSFCMLAPIARVAQRAGGRGGLLIASALGAIGFASYLWATTPLLIALSAVVVALGDRLMGACWPLLAGERFERVHLQDVFALANAAKTLALGVGALVASTTLAFAPVDGLRVALIVNAASFTIGFLVLLGVPAVDRPSSPRNDRIGLAVVVRDRRFVGVVVSQTALSAGWMLPAMAFPLFATESIGLPAAVAVGCLAFRYVLVTALQVPLVRMAGAWSRTRILAVSVVSAVAGVLIVAVAPLLPTVGAAAAMFAATAFLGGSEVVSKPTAMASAMSTAPSGGRGAYMAVFQMTWSLSYALGPGVVGIGLGWPPALWAGVVLVIVGGTVANAVLARRSVDPELAGAEADDDRARLGLDRLNG